MTISRRWKDRERAAARMLGTERIPSSGKAAPDALPVIAGRIIGLEHKSRESLPTWLTQAMAQAARNAPAGALPVVAISAGAGPGRALHRLAIVRLADLPALLEACGREEAS